MKAYLTQKGKQLITYFLWYSRALTRKNLLRFHTSRLHKLTTSNSEIGIPQPPLITMLSVLMKNVNIRKLYYTRFYYPHKLHYEMPFFISIFFSTALLHLQMCHVWYIYKWLMQTTLIHVTIIYDSLRHEDIFINKYQNM